MNKEKKMKVTSGNWGGETFLNEKYVIFVYL